MSLDDNALRLEQRPGERLELLASEKAAERLYIYI